MSDEPTVKKGFFGKISKALSGSQSTKNISEAAGKGNELTPKSSGLIKYPSKTSSSLSNIAGRESRESIRKSSDDVAGQNGRKSREGNTAGLGSKESINSDVIFASNARIKKLAGSGENSKISSPQGNIANPGNNAAYQAIKQFNQQQTVKKIGRASDSQSFEQPTKPITKPIAAAIPNSNNVSPLNSFQSSSLAKIVKESWLSSAGTSLPSSTIDSKECLDMDHDLQKRKDSSASQTTTHVLSSSAKQSNLPKSTDALLAQLRNNVSLKIASSQQTMIDSRSMSGLAVIASGEVAAPAMAAPRSMVTSTAVSNGNVGMSKRGISNTAANNRDSTGSAANPVHSSTIKEELAKYKQNLNGEILKNSHCESEGQRNHVTVDRARSNTGQSSSVGAQAVKSPFGGVQVHNGPFASPFIGAVSPFAGATGPFQPTTSGPKSRKTTIDSYDQESELKTIGIMRKKQTSQLGEEVKDENESSNYRVKALKTIHSSTIEETNSNEDFGFDQDSIFAVKGNVHLVQCFPSGGSPFILNNGWETEVFSDTRYNVWRRVVFETIPAQRDLPLILPEDLYEYLET